VWGAHNVDKKADPRFAVGEKDRRHGKEDLLDGGQLVVASLRRGGGGGGVRCEGLGGEGKSPVSRRACVCVSVKRIFTMGESSL
jgi:hypothetical protein